MDIRHLLYFVEVAKQESFTKAADALYLTQPTISKMVKSLEDELGVTLIRRSTKHIELTDAGYAVLNQAQQIVESMKNLEVELNDVLQLRKGSIRIGLPPMVGSLYFAPIIGAFKAAFPQIELHLFEEGARSLEKKVEDGIIYVAVCTLPLHSQKLETVEIIKEPLVVIFPKAHRLTQTQGISIEQISNEKLVLFTDDFGLHERVLSCFSMENFQPQVSCVSSQWDFIMEMVAAGMGVSMLPAKVCENRLIAGVRAVPLQTPVYWDLILTWDRQRYQSFATRQWIEFSCNYFLSGKSKELV